MSDRIAEAKVKLDQLYSQLVDAHRDPDPVSQRKRLQFTVTELRWLADRLDPDAGRER